MGGMDRSTLAGRFAALLLMSTCLAGIAAPALADGGSGGPDSMTGAGGNGINSGVLSGSGGGIDNHALNVGLRSW